jgi:hypothetical protein
MELLGKSDRYRIFLSIDMLIADGLSLFELCREIKYFLTHPSESPADRLDDLLFMTDYYKDQRLTGRYFKSRDYYLKNLESIYPAPALGYINEQPDGIFCQLDETLPDEVFTALCKQADLYNLTATEVLLTAYALVLLKWSQNKSMSINMTTFKRPRDIKYTSVIGDFTSSMLIQSAMSMDESFLENARSIKKAIIVAYNYSLFEAPEVIREISKTNPGSIMPIVFTSMLYDGTDLWDSNFQYDYSISQTSQVFLHSQVKKLGDELNITWNYRKGVFLDKQIKAMFEDYMLLINDFVLYNQDMTVRFKRRFLEQTTELYSLYNSKTSPGYEDKLYGLKDLFLNTVNKYKEKTFITIENRSYTFGWVYEKALVLQGLISKKKAEYSKQKTRIAFSGIKNIETIISITASILSGDSFCIINEDYGDCKITDTLMQLKNYVYIKDNNFLASDCNTSIAADESYILFTSGTTGKPKGIIRLPPLQVVV